MLKYLHADYNNGKDKKGITQYIRFFSFEKQTDKMNFKYTQLVRRPHTDQDNYMCN